MSSKLKLGDVVRTLCDTDGVEAGTLGTIVCHPSDRGCNRVHFTALEDRGLKLPHYDNSENCSGGCTGINGTHLELVGHKIKEEGVRAPEEGDRVRIIGVESHVFCSFVEHEHFGHEGTIYQVIKCGWGHKLYVTCDCNNSTLSSMPDVAVQYLNEEPTGSKENNMSEVSISQKLRAAKLDDDTKLLIDEGIISDNGTLTEEGARVVRDYAFAANRAEILADLRKTKTTKESK